MKGVGRDVRYAFPNEFRGLWWRKVGVRRKQDRCNIENVAEECEHEEVH
jgi:hypothetical protein